MPGKDTGLRSQTPVDRTLLDDFIASLSDKVKVASLVVFGSRALGDNLESSDYDILVLSPDFEDHDRLSRIQLLLESWPGPVALEPVALTPEEFAEAEGALIWDILLDGLVIRDDGAFGRKLLPFRQRLEKGELARDEAGCWSFR